MFRRTALIATAALAALFLTPAANAESGHNLDAYLIRGSDLPWDRDGWVAGPGQSFHFSVMVVNTGGQADIDLSVFVSVPFEVTGYSGEGWDCWDVDGGVECSIPDLVVDQESWPRLTIEAVAGPDVMQDSIDAYADSRHGDVHTGVVFKVREAG
jgi:hypothetical protein